jgi:hypothetical protein
MNNVPDLSGSTAAAQRCLRLDFLEAGEVHISLVYDGLHTDDLPARNAPIHADSVWPNFGGERIRQPNIPLRPQ